MLSVKFISLNENGEKSYLSIWDALGQSGHTIEWHMGKDKSEMEYFKGKYEPYSVQADGYELEYILTHFSSLPTCEKEVQTWHGPFAKFIVENL